MGRATSLAAGLGAAMTGCTPANAPRAGRATPRPQTIIRGNVGPSIDEFVAGKWPPGASGTVLAARVDQIVFGRGFGMADREAKIPCGIDTVYDIGSVTKQFTAAGILKLEMMGEVAVTDTIGKLLGPGAPEDKRTITLHHLLTHTSGLNEFLPEKYGGDYDELSRDDMLAATATTRLRSRPGKKYHYSNLGFSVLAAIIEKVSGTGYERFLAKHLLAPAGMDQTGYVLPRWKSPDVVVEYDSRGRRHERPSDYPQAGDGPHWNLRGNGGLLTTARDMFRWHVALEGDKVLSREAKRRMFTRGYGWAVDGDTVQHDGQSQVGGSAAQILKYPDDAVMAFVATGYVEHAGRWNLADLDLASQVAELALDG